MAAERTAEPADASSARFTSPIESDSVIRDPDHRRHRADRRPGTTSQATHRRNFNPSARLQPSLKRRPDHHAHSELNSDHNEVHAAIPPVQANEIVVPPVNNEGNWEAAGPEVATTEADVNFEETPAASSLDSPATPMDAPPSEAPTEVIEVPPSEAPTEVIDVPPATEAQAQPTDNVPPLTTNETHAPEKPEIKLDLHLAGIDDHIRERSLEVAEKRLQEEALEGGRIKRFARQIWKGTYAHEYYREKYAQEAQAEMRQDGGNQFAPEGSDRRAHQRATAALIDRLIASEQNPDVELGQGERVERMGETEGETALQDGMRRIIGRYAEGHIDAEALHEARTRLLDQLHEQYPDLIDGARVVADNLIGVAEQAKALVEHGRSIEDITNAINFYHDQARAGVRTETQHNAVDRIIGRLQGTRIGAMVNETTLALGVSIAVSTSKVFSMRAAGAAASAIAPGIVAGGFAGLRENMRFKQERAQHMRERAQGASFEEGSERREKMDGAVYEAKSATSLADSLSVNPEDITPHRASELLQQLAEIKARQQISDTHNVDLISFSSLENVDPERTSLDLAAATAMANLRRWISSAGDAERSQVLGSNDLDTALSLQKEAAAITLSEEMRGVDKTFKNMKRAAVGKAVAKGVITGLTFGIAAQEVAATATDGKQGVLESLWKNDKPNPNSHQTFLRGLFREETVAKYGTDEALASPSHYERTDGHNTVKLPEGFRLKHHGDEGMMSLDYGNETIVSDLHMTDEGFTPESEKALRELGILSDDHLSRPIEHTTRSMETTSAEQYFKQHRQGSAHVERTLWYDNDTPAPVFDKNELRLWWGGQNGLTEGGNYQFNVSQMTPDGSYHTPGSVNAREQIREGNMRILLSANEQTQTHPFSYKIDANGNVQIPKDSVAGRSLFSNEDGRAVFRGRYAEVAQVVGNQDGRTQVKLLATYEGEGVDSMQHEVTKTSITHRRVTEIHIPKVRVPVDAPPVIPVTWRKEMEPAKNVETLTPITGREYGYAGGSIASLREWVKENPDSLRPRRQITQDGKKMWVEADGSEVARSVDRERQTAQAYLDRIGVTHPEYRSYLDQLANLSTVSEMSPECKISVIIPAWMEGGNIYNLLDLYSQQTDKEGNPLNPNLYEFNICINRKTGSEPDNSVEEIQRFIADKAAQGINVNINYIDVQFDPPYNNVGNARKVITDLVLLRSLQRENQESALYVETEDADLTRISSRTIINAITKMDENPHLDAVKGQDDRDPRILKENDFLFLSRRLWDFSARIWSEKEYRPENNPDWNFSWNRVYTHGWNTAYSLEAYALIGGYDVTRTVGEDLDIGEKITMLRGDGEMPNLDVVGRVSTRMHSSPRRYVNEILTGKGAYAGDNFTDEEVNNLIRTSSIEELMETIKPVSRIEAGNEDQFKQLFTSYFDNMKNSTPNLGAAQKGFDKLAFWIGLDKSAYRYSGDNIIISNLDSVKEKLDEYRANPPKVAQ